MRLAAALQTAVLGCAVVWAAGGAAASRAQTLVPATPQQLMTQVVENENAAAQRNERYDYISNERSGRTGGHLWTERVVETAPGRMRLLLAVDGKPLSPEARSQERDRLEHIREHPEEFIQHEKNTRAEEKRARQMMEVLPKDFLFENVRLADGVWRMDFRPNPDYSPSGIEERILHEMAGTLVVDAKELRLLHMDFHLTQDVPIGFGLLADVHTGTNFVSDRQLTGGHWHTTHVSTQVRAKAVLFKNVDLNVELTRSEFHLLDHDVRVPEAAMMLLNQQIASTR
jgi:hypothetical protein